MNEFSKEFQEELDAAALKMFEASYAAALAAVSKAFGEGEIGEIDQVTFSGDGLTRIGHR